MVSPLAQMQERYLAMGSNQQAMAEIAALAQLRPDILDNLDFDQYIRTLADAYGMDKRVIVNMADVRRVRQARDQAQAQMRQFAMQQEAAKTGADIMSKLPPEMIEGEKQ
jgi:glucose-6-phosphate-specific signal transduction histidine kinase